MKATPSQTYRASQVAPQPPIYQGIDAWLHGWGRRFRRAEGRRCELENAAQRIHVAVEDVGDWSEGRLRKELAHFRKQARACPDRVEQIPEAALAAIGDAARRTLGLYAHPVQIMASLAMLRGELVEVATGEGKTLAIALAVVVRAWTGLPCHVVTANDYLAARDAKYLGKFFELCGVTVGHVIGKMTVDKRRSQYRCGVVYTTAKELAADYLRDGLIEQAFDHPGRRLIRRIHQPRAAAQDPSRRVLRGLHSVIVDEADNALIDEAVTPLIISESRENKGLEEATLQAVDLCRDFVLGEHYDRDEATRTVELRDEGYCAIAAASHSLSGIWQGESRRVELVLKALEAREFFHRDSHYVVEDDTVVIVDENTGRRMPGRTWRQGLHQAIEAREGVKISSPAVTVASISFQRFFRQFHVIAGATGTASEAAGEFWRIYRLRVNPIALHQPCIRRELASRVFATRDEKWAAVVEECRSRHQTGQPILVGTRSVGDSEALARLLSEVGLSCQILNAVRHRDEAAVIARAGRLSRITIATNMAGRGTDIRLETDVDGRGGLCVIATEWHASARVDRQLYGRSGRQGDPGVVIPFASLEDDLSDKFLAKWSASTLKKLLKTGIPGVRMVARMVLKRCQKRSEKEAFRRRENVLKADDQRAKSLGFTTRF